MKILGVGLNYPPHNNSDEKALYKPEEPVIFSKADSSLLKSGKPFFIPDFMGAIDYETEIVVRICKLGKSIPERFAHRYYDAVTVGIDFTAREYRQRFQEKRLPWELCKSFDGAAVIGEWVDVGRFKSIDALNFHLDIDGQRAQTGFTGDMFFKVDEIIAYISRFITLKTGDILYTGTPAGVDKVNIDNHLEGYLEDRKVLDFYCR